MAVYAVVVDARNDRVAEFYRQFGFIPLPRHSASLACPRPPKCSFAVFDAERDAQRDAHPLPTISVLSHNRAELDLVFRVEAGAA